MSPITTHVLDTAHGRPAAGMAVALHLLAADGEARELGRGATDADGRLKTLLSPDAALEPGTYRLSFDTGGWYAARGESSFYPRVRILFTVSDPAAHYHVPLLLSPYGYSTYRGS
jgi:5-hydroxyisourate hydrolase